MRTDKASVAMWEGVFKVSSGEVLTDVANVTDQLRCGADDLHMGLTTKKKPRSSPSEEGILKSELVRLPMSLRGQSEDAMSILEDCWEDLVGNQSAAVNMSIAAGNLAEKLRKTIEGELDQVNIKFAQLKRGHRVIQELSSEGFEAHPRLSHILNIHLRDNAVSKSAMDRVLAELSKEDSGPRTAEGDGGQGL